MSDRVSGSFSHGRGSQQVTVTFRGTLDDVAWDEFITRVVALGHRTGVEVVLGLDEVMKAVKAMKATKGRKGRKAMKGKRKAKVR